MIRSAFLIIATTILATYATWQNDYQSAVKIAKEKHQLVLINFSGSDWCGPCIKMKKQIFDSPVFAEMANENIVLYNADFPRSKKNKLEKKIEDQNNQLAEKYNSAGKFPFTVLTDEDGKVLKTWDGLPSETPESFTASIKKICDARR